MFDFAIHLSVLKGESNEAFFFWQPKAKIYIEFRSFVRTFRSVVSNFFFRAQFSFIICYYGALGFCDYECHVAIAWTVYFVSWTFRFFIQFIVYDFCIIGCIFGCTMYIIRMISFVYVSINNWSFRIWNFDSIVSSGVDDSVCDLWFSIYDRNVFVLFQRLKRSDDRLLKLVSTLIAKIKKNQLASHKAKDEFYWLKINFNPIDGKLK